VTLTTRARFARRERERTSPIPPLQACSGTLVAHPSKTFFHEAEAIAILATHHMMNIMQN
jgi:hypothetical protein